MSRFEDVLTIKNGRNQKNVENPNGEYPIYGSGGIIGYADNYICETDTVIIGRKGNINNPIYVSEPFWNVDTAFGLVANSDILLPKYLYYFCEKFDFQKLNTTVTIPSLTKANLLKINISLPPLEEQKKIAEILDKVNNLISLRKKQIEKFNLLVKARFLEMFGNPFTNEKFYDFDLFENFMERCVDIGSNGANKVVVDHLDMKDTEDYALLVRTLNFTANDFERNVKYISKDAYEFFAKSKVYGGEIIFNKIGSAGINFLMPNLNRPVSLGLNQIMITPKNINTKYLYYLLNTEYGKFQINSRVQGAVTKSIQKTELKKIPIMSPPIDLQNQFADFVQQVENQKAKLKTSLEKLELTYKALMQQYFK